MKQLHRSDLFGWSVFDEARNLDFHGLCWQGPRGNVLVDPMPMTAHDLAHLDALGGVHWIVCTNSDHTRAVAELAERFGAEVAGPGAEQAAFPIAIDRWLADGDEVLGARVVTLDGSKTPGEVALVIGDTLVCGDLVRGHVGGRLNLLPDPKLVDKQAALASVSRLAALDVDAVLVGDGWHVFTGGRAALRALAAG